jgi:hypothetical protein
MFFGSFLFSLHGQLEPVKYVIFRYNRNYLLYNLETYLITSNSRFTLCQVSFKSSVFVRVWIIATNFVWNQLRLNSHHLQ